jgi:hypothetical protein
MPTIWASLNRDFFTMVSFEAGGLRILHLFLGHFSGYTSASASRSFFKFMISILYPNDLG